MNDDTSALLAILRAKPEAAAMAAAMAGAGSRRISAGTLLETANVIRASHDPIASGRPAELSATAGIEIEPVTAGQARIGREACRDFGRGSGHPAKLSFGDCFACALAKTGGEPLLFEGHDLVHTDIPARLGWR
ncbi:MAG: type II toxin-antitoxin system VapC family toxin [Dehalococcoidia bacterium]